MDDLAIRNNIARQYGAALAMLGHAIELCPESLWLAPECQNRFWHIAYHVVFCTHMYLQPSLGEFHPWTKHREDSQFLGHKPGAPPDAPLPVFAPYSKPDVLEYFALCRAEEESRVPAPDLEAPSGFWWLPFNKLELQLYNIRHLQHHTGQLADRLRTAAGIGVEWVAP